MSRNAAGTYTLPLPPVAAGETVEAEWANETLDDLAQALTDSLDRYGRGGMLAPFKFIDGTVTVPSIAFVNEPSSGLYRESAGSVAMSILGVQAMKVTAAGVTSKEFFSTAAPSSGSSLMSKDAVTAALVPYQLIATAWNTGNFNPGTKQDVATAWNTGNFSPATKATLGSDVTFNSLVSNGQIYVYGQIRSPNSIRGTSIVATPSP